MEKMTKSDLRNKRITVMGLGEHGGALGNIEWLHRQGAILTVTDLKPAPSLKKSLKKLGSLPNIKLVLGEHQSDDFINTDLILRNPAVPRHSSFLKIARDHQVPVVMDSSLFFKYCLSHKIIGVTGSKGKTTTTMAIAHLAKALPIGIENTSPLKSLDQITRQTTVAFELSSWRLEDLDSSAISPSWAVVTSLYPDHLNTYGSFADYENAKKTIFRWQTAQDTILLNADDARLVAWRHEVKSRLLWYSSKSQIPGDGIYLADGWVQIHLSGKTLRLCQIENIPFSSAHEQRNVLPAILISYLHGITPAEIISRIKTLPTLPHRLEQVRTVSEISFINDSAATIPDATIAALISLHSQNIVHILGGNDKKLDFTEWALVESKANIRQLVWLPGNANSTMKNLLHKAGRSVKSIDASNMAEAVTAAYQIAERGDVVLLSPGATSFGSFKNEFDRGDQFKKAVKDLVKKNKSK